MRIVITLDDEPQTVVGAHIEGVTEPTSQQREALREVAVTAGYYRRYLLGDPAPVGP